MAAEIALPQGYALHEYRVEQTLGIGGFGLTYLATDSNLNLKVAIKEYLPGDLAQRGEDQSVQPKSESSSESFKWGLSRFLDESRTLASFRHPNIVRVLRFFETNSTAYMVMEFVAGSPSANGSAAAGRSSKPPCSRSPARCSMGWKSFIAPGTSTEISSPATSSFARTGRRCCST